MDDVESFGNFHQLTDSESQDHHFQDTLLTLPPSEALADQTTFSEDAGYGPFLTVNPSRLSLSTSPPCSTRDSRSDPARSLDRKSSIGSSRSDLFMNDLSPNGADNEVGKTTLLHETDIQMSAMELENDNNWVGTGFEFEPAAASPLANNDMFHFQGMPDDLYSSFDRKHFDASQYRPAPGHIQLHPQVTMFPEDRHPTQAANVSANETPANSLDYVTALRASAQSLHQTFESPRETNANSCAESLGPTPHMLTDRAHKHAQPSTTPFRAPKSQLAVYLTPQKSRVETQIPVRLILYSVPSGVSKIHLEAHSISKPKLLAKNDVTPSADMLELSTTLVCTSAMRDHHQLQKALARAAGNLPSPASRDEFEPLKGDPVQICDNCVLREQKRAARKKTKKPEEEAAWLRHERNRVVIFNTAEISELQVPTADDISESGLRLNSSRGAVKIDLPMRIACYCRHQNEKQGFQVIFTIRNHLGQLVAQQISSSIVITDDHKAHPVNVQSHSSGHTTTSLSRKSSSSRSPTSPETNGTVERATRSVPDLQSLRGTSLTQSTADSKWREDYPESSKSTAISSAATSTHGSRQVSPVTNAGPSLKRRKASGSTKLPENLTMTSMDGLPSRNRATITDERSLHSNARISNPQESLSPAASDGPIYVAYQSQQASPLVSYETDWRYLPIARDLTERDAANAAHRGLSNPASVHHSRTGSPNSLPHAQYSIRENAPGRNSSLTLMAQRTDTIQSRLRPTINKLIPAEGPQSGGIEITLLGSGFSQGLEVMFGDTLATTTTFWGEQSLVCLLPPASRPGQVHVTFKHEYLQDPNSALTSMPRPQVFNYIDDNEQRLMRQALLIVHQSMTGDSADPGEIARKIISSTIHKSNNRGNFETNDTSYHIRNLQMQLIQRASTEDIALACLAFISFSTSPHPVDLDSPCANGQTMLHLAAGLKFKNLLTALLSQGCDPNARDANGLSPLHIAALYGHESSVRRLRLYGSDPGLRSLRGFRAAHMTKDKSILAALAATSLQRTKSLTDYFSMQSSRRLHRKAGKWTDGNSPSSLAPISSTPGSDGSSYATSDSSSTSEDIVDSIDDSYDMAQDIKQTEPNSFLVAWRDNLVAQIQTFQHAVYDTLPNLQLANLPPLQAMNDYNTPAVMRRIGAMAPAKPARAKSSSASTHVREIKWWDFLSKISAAPPAYDEVFPHRDTLQKGKQDCDVNGVSIVKRGSSALKFEPELDETSDASELGTVCIGKSGLTIEQREQLQRAHAKRVKSLGHDRKLFLIWIPLLLIFVILSLKDKVPMVGDVFGAVVASLPGSESFKHPIPSEA